MTITRMGLAACALLLCGAAQAAEIALYKQQNFGGERLALREASYDLAALNFHDQVSSIVVHSGEWEVCTQPDFRGDCVVLGAGTYAALDTRINHRIESLREAPGYRVDRREVERVSAATAPPALWVFEPGRHTDLGRMSNQVVSARRIP